MRKIPSLLVRDPATHRAAVPYQVVDGCAWVLAGEGTATAKADGTAVRYHDGVWWTRRQVRAHRAPPPGFACVDTDPAGTRYGWEPAAASGYARVLAAAVDALDPAALPGGATYELVGPSLQGNPHRLPCHMLVRHGAAVLPGCPRDPAALPGYLAGLPWEGVVWHHPDGRRAKVKRRDLGLPWPVPR